MSKINRARFRLQRVILVPLLVITMFVTLGGAVLASNITTATYYGLVRVTNNSTEADNVSTVMTLSSADMIDQGWLDEDFTRVAMRYPSGADVPFMPSANSTNPWCLFVPNIDNMMSTNYFFYTGPSDLSATKYYFPDTNGMYAGDDGTIELSDNGTIEISGRIETDNQSTPTKDIVIKQSAFKVIVSNTVSGNITACVSATANSTANMTADGNSTPLQLTPSAGSNYQCIDEIPANDADYVYIAGGAPASLVDQYTLSASGLADTSFINTVNMTIRIRSDQAGALTYGRPFLYLNGESTNGTLRSVTGTTVVEYNESFARPGGGVWDIGDLANLEAGINLIADNGTTYSICTQLFVAVNYSLADATASIVDVDSGEHTVKVDVIGDFLGLGVDVGDNVTVPDSTNLTLNLPLHHNDMDGATLISKDENGFSATVTGAIWGTYGRTFSHPDNINLGKQAELQDFTEKTVIITIKPEGFTGSARGVYGMGYHANPFGDMSYLDAGSNKIYIYIKNSAGDLAIVSSTFTADEWLQLGYSWNGTTVNWYKNGVTYDVPDALVGSVNCTAEDCIIGDVPAYDSYSGVFGEIQVYRRGLSSTEMLAHYNTTKWRYDGTTSDESNTYYTYNVMTLGVPDNSNSLYSLLNGSVPYLESQLITINGTDRQEIEWEYDDTSFSDLSGNGNIAYPTFRTLSSDLDVSAELISYEPLDPALAPAFAVSAAPDFVSSNITIDASTANFTSGNVTAGAFPGSTLIDTVAAEGGTPNIWIWGLIGAFTIAMAGLFISYMEMRHGGGSGTLILRMVIAIFVFGFLTAIDKFDFWMLIMYLLIAATPAIASRQIDWGGSISELGLIGFLSMVWIGLTTINRIQEGQLITSAETSHLNRLMFTQEFTLLDVFHLPIINFEFFSKGIPSLLRWDYGFFGGNAQLIQYFLYSLTAIVSFIVLMVIIGTVSSFFARRA